MATLEQVIQQMIDDGKSEADITAFVQQVKARQKPYVAKPPVDGGPESYWAGVANSLKPGGSSDQAALAGAKGFAKGVLPGVGEGAIGVATLPISLLKAVIGMVGGAGNLINDPVKTLEDAWESVKSIPGQGRDAVEAALKVAGQDPEAFGKEVGKLTGNAEAGIAAAKLVPMLPKPLAEKVGGAAETFGKRARWPLRISGAHQIIGGNVLGGIGTMMAPELVEGTGSAMKKWGAPPPLNESGARTYELPKTRVTTPIRVQSRPAPTVSSERIPVMGGAAEESPRVQKVMAKEQAVKVKANEAVDAEQLKKLKEFQDAKAAEAKAQETASKDIETHLGKSLDAAGNPAAEGLKDLDAAIADEAKQGAQRRAASAKRETEMAAQERKAEVERDASLKQEEADKKAQEDIDKQIEDGKLVAGAPRITKTVKAPGSTMTTTYGPGEGTPTGAAPTGDLTPWEQEMLRRSGGRPGNGGVSSRTGNMVRPVDQAAAKSSQTLPDVPARENVAPLGVKERALSAGEEAGIAALDQIDEFHGRGLDTPSKGNGLYAPGTQSAALKQAGFTEEQIATMSPEDLAAEMGINDEIGLDVAGADLSAGSRAPQGATARTAAQVEQTPAGAPEASLAPASRSRRATSGTPGISANDLAAMKQIIAENPDLSPEEIAQELVKQRAQRSSMYRSEARLSKLEQQALDRDTSGEE